MYPNNARIITFRKWKQYEHFVETFSNKYFKMLFIKWFLYKDGQVDLNFKLIMLIHSLEKISQVTY